MSAAAAKSLPDKTLRRTVLVVASLLEETGGGTVAASVVAKRARWDEEEALARLHSAFDAGLLTRQTRRGRSPSFGVTPWIEWPNPAWVRLAGAAVFSRPLPYVRERGADPPLAKPEIVAFIQSDPFWTATLRACGPGVTIHHLAHLRAAEIAESRATTHKRTAP
jgi:hypothetical protein